MSANLKTVAPGMYRHYKGAEYEVLYTARHSETEEWLVVYRQCYGDNSIWVRPLDMFVGNVVSANGETKARFQAMTD